MSLLFLVRHGAAEGSGGPDPGLSAVGREQAAALGRRLATQPVAALLHSPKQRAVETADVLSAALPGAAVAGSDLLDDRTPVPSAARRADYPAGLQAWFDQLPAAGQDVDGVLLDAAVQGLRRVVLAAPGPVVAVTHAFVVGWFVRAVLDAPVTAWTAIAPDNAGLTVIDHSTRGSTLVAVNDTGHLAG